jgi:EmrB/QacA subfamily drug resistance transporter
MPTPDVVSDRIASGAHRWWTLAVLSLTQLVLVLDGTIVSIALPQAQMELGMSDAERQWVITAYALAFGALLLIGGRVSDYWGRKRAFVLGMIGFGVASVWGGLAQSGGELIAARGLQGLFAAVLAPAALSMLTVAFPSGKERNLAFAVFGTIAGTGAAIGLVLGGVLTEFTDWRWCLLVNIFFVIAGLLGALFVLKESKPQARHRLDIWGAATVTLGLGSLVYGFTLAEHGWDSIDTIAFLAGGVILLSAFVVIESRVEHPILPLRVILHPVRGAAFLIQAVIGSVMIGSLLYLNFHFQLVMGMSPFIAGLANVVMTVVIMVSVPFATKVLNAFGPRPLMVGGPIVAAIGLLYLSRVTADGSYVVEVLPALIALGIGFAMLFATLQNLALSGVEPEDAGAASATVNSMMNIGGSVGLSVFTVIYAGVVGAGAAGTVSSETLAAGHSAVFLASAVGMGVAALISVFLVRGSKQQLMPHAGEHTEHVPAH